jgi:O-antigen ligase
MTFSFLLNLIFSFDPIDFQFRRIVSFSIALLLLSGFFVARRFTEIKHDSLIKGIVFTYSLVIIFFAIVLFSQSSTDLYQVREVIGQRLPFAIAYAGTLGMVYYRFGKGNKNILLMFVLLSLLSVILSLTRAAYIQLFISFAILFAAEIKKYFFRGIVVVALLLGVLGITYNFTKEDPFVKQVADRLELMLDVKRQSEKDPSGAFRLEMWKFLIGKISNDPVRMIIGYGQLGPTLVAQEFVSSDGTTGNNAHSQYLDILVREGIVGLFLFLRICFKLVFGGYARDLEFSKKGHLFLFANSIALSGLLFYSFFHETFRYPLFGFYFWIYAGMFSVVYDVKKENTDGIIKE